MEKGAILILHFEFKFNNNQKTLAFFLEYWAKKSGLDYSITFKNDDINLYINGDEQSLSKFNDEFIIMVPHSVFLQNSSVKIEDEMPKNSDLKFDFSLENITPLSLKDGINEFGFSSDESLINEAISEINAGKSFIYDGYEISKFDNFDCSYLLSTGLKTAPKVFVCDEKSLIALASFEKPVVSLKLNALFRTNHKDAPMYFDLRSAWDLNIYKICDILNKQGINFLKVKSTKDDFKISVLDDSFLVLKNSKFLQQGDLDFIHSRTDKNLALFGLVLKEYDLLNKSVCRIFLSKHSTDFIKVYKGEDEFNLLNLKAPESFDEIYAKIASFEGGERLLDNYKASYSLPSGDINLANNFYSIFMIVDKILGFNGMIFDYARDFGGQKGVRIDYKMSSKDEFDWIRLIRSAMSFKLAGAEPKNISFGCFESLALFLSDFGDIIKDEFECANMLLTGSLFENKVIANLTLKYSNSNYKTCFSGYYPLEIT